MRGRLEHWWRSLESRSGPIAAWPVLAVLLALGADLNRASGWPAPGVPRTGQVVSLLSFLPDPLLRADWLYRGAQVAFIAASILWLARVALPFSSWTAAASLLVVQCLLQESRAYCSHSGHLLVQAVFVFALFTHFDREALRSAPRGAGFWRSPLVPRWLWAALAWLVAWFYTLAGWTKLQDSGLGWADGLSLQLYITALAPQPDSPAASLMLESRTIAQLTQLGTLACECLALPALLFAPIRVLVGLSLVSFHVGQQLVFGYPFYANMTLVALVFLPIVPALERRHGRSSD